MNPNERLVMLSTMLVSLTVILLFQASLYNPVNVDVAPYLSAAISSEFPEPQLRVDQPVP